MELAQRLGTQSNNSRFLDPNPQATSRLELNYTHPLLNGSGRFYNNSRIVLAQIDSRLSRDEVTRLLQDHLLQVTGSYWDLYRARTRYVQRTTLLQAADRILEQLSAREQVDALDQASATHRAAVAKRRSEIVRAATQIDNAEAQLRVLVNDPALVQAAELTPLVTPLRARVDVSLSDSLTTALVHHPEISLAIRNLDATAVRLGVARNELLPKLDLLLSTYVAGLEGDAPVCSLRGATSFPKAGPASQSACCGSSPKGIARPEPASNDSNGNCSRPPVNSRTRSKSR